jgi:hypothetical protein
MAEHEMPPEAAVMQLVTNLWATQAVATFARMRIPDHLAAGARTAPELAAAVGANPDALFRLLRAVASVGVLSADRDGRFALTPVGQTLRSDVPRSMRAFLVAETAPGHWLPWGQLEESVRTGKPATHKALGSAIWDYYAAHPEEGHDFSQAMSGMSALATDAVLAAYSFDGARRVVDVGGAHGAFLGAVLGRLPDARGVLFDLPHVVDGAAPSLREAGVFDRTERVGGSFFESVPSGGDVYLVKHILHDWNDDECVRILERVRAAMAPDGRIVVVEMVIDPDGPPSPAALLDLNMLVMLTGRERSIVEFEALFRRAGLRLAKVAPTPSPFVVLEARA